MTVWCSAVPKDEYSVELDLRCVCAHCVSMRCCGCCQLSAHAARPCLEVALFSTRNTAASAGLQTICACGTGCPATARFGAAGIPYVPPSGLTRGEPSIFSIAVLNFEQLTDGVAKCHQAKMVLRLLLSQIFVTPHVHQAYGIISRKVCSTVWISMVSDVMLCCVGLMVANMTPTSHRSCWIMQDITIDNGRLMLWRKAQRPDSDSQEQPPRHNSCCLNYSGVGKGTSDSQRQGTSGSNCSPKQRQGGQDSAKVSPQEGSGGGSHVPAPCDAV